MMLIGMAGIGRDVSDLLHELLVGLVLSQGGLVLSQGGLDPIQGDLDLFQEDLALTPGGLEGPGGHDPLGQDRQS